MRDIPAKRRDPAPPDAPPTVLGVHDPVREVLAQGEALAQQGSQTPTTPRTVLTRAEAVAVAQRAGAEKAAQRFSVWGPIFLDALGKSGVVLVGLKAAGISRDTALYRRRVNPKFRRAWDMALENAWDTIEAAMIVAARKGDVAAGRMMLSAWRRRRYGDVVRQEHTVPADAPGGGSFRFTMRIGGAPAPVPGVTAPPVAPTNGHDADPDESTAS